MSGLVRKPLKCGSSWWYRNFTIFEIRLSFMLHLSFSPNKKPKLPNTCHYVAKPTFDRVRLLENGTINHDNEVELLLIACVDICGSNQIKFKFDKKKYLSPLLTSRNLFTHIYTVNSPHHRCRPLTVANNRDSWHVNKTEMQEKPICDQLNKYPAQY